MIDDVDRTLERLLRERVPLPPAQVEITFDLPSETWAQRELTGDRLRVNLYLYDVRENHDLRSPLWREEIEADGHIVRRRPPARIDLFYCVTAWSPAQPPEITSEHRLLGDLLRTLLRYPTVPRDVLQGALVGQEPPLPTLVAQPDGGLPHPPAEFWSALGNRLRPALNFVVTVAVQPGAALEVPERLTPVTGVDLRLGVGVEPLDRVTVHPALSAARDAEDPVRTAEAAAEPAARVGTAVRASARTLRVLDGRDLRANEWILVDDANREVVWVAMAPGPGPSEIEVDPPLRSAHAANANVRRVTLGVPALTTLEERAAAGATTVRVANGNGIAANARLLLDDGRRAELVQVAAAAAPGPATVSLRGALRFSHEAAAPLRTTTTGAVVTRLAEAANQRTESITLTQRAPLTNGAVSAGAVLMVGSGAGGEFARAGAIPASPSRTIPVSPPLRGNHDVDTPLRVVTPGEEKGQLAARVPAEATELPVAGAEPDALKAGQIVGVGPEAEASFHMVDAVTRTPGAVAGPAEGPMNIAGDVVDDTDPPRPVAAAAVFLEEAGARTTSDEAGRFAFADVPAGVYHVAVTATGYASARKEVRVPAEAANEYRVQLAPG